MTKHMAEKKSDDKTGSAPPHILDAALALYLEFGLRRTTMDDVASRAGVGRMTLYRQYPEKNALFQAVVLRECARSAQRVEKTLRKTEDPAQRFIEAFAQVVHGARHHPLIQRLMETEPQWLLPSLSVKADIIIAQGRPLVATYLRQEQARGLSINMDVDFLAELLLRLLQSLVLTPGGLIAPQSLTELRQVAQQHLLPLVMAGQVPR